MSYVYRACLTLTAGSARCIASRAQLRPGVPVASFASSARSRFLDGHASASTTLRAAWPATTQGLARRMSSSTVSESRAKKLEHDETAKETSQRDLDEHERDVKQAIAQTTKQQIRRPWQREGADEPPVNKHRTEMNKKMAKGKLLTTPTRLLKLILPLPVDALHDEHGNRGEFRSLGQNQEIQPLALLIHPQQPLSYLERLIQAELPPTVDKEGREKMPNVYFLAEATTERDEPAKQMEKKKKKGNSTDGKENEDEDTHAAKDPSKGRKNHEEQATPATPAAGGAKDFVRWSSSTEIGDFIRDAAKGREFAIKVDGQDEEMRVSVPSFDDRTHYMRVRLRRISRKIEEQSKIKRECDQLAHRGAHRLAQAGFGAMSAWWGTVYYLTFHTDLGWDYMEPVTYLAGLATIMGGYLWFLFISRELSYQAALKITVSRRQSALYQARGFDANVWEAFVHDANDLRREIRKVADEYDIEYDEAKDVGSEELVEVLEKEEKKQRKKSKDEDEDEDDDEREDDGGDGKGGREKSSESKPRSD